MALWNSRLLDLNDLATGDIPAITPARGAMMAEGAGVCLESQGHALGVTLQVRGGSGNSYSLYWPPISSQAHGLAWTVPDDAVEAGAVGVAALLIVLQTGLTTIERSLRGTGVDYWLGPPETLPFQRRARLEMSGILHGSDSDIRARVRQKLNQTRRSDKSGLPAYVIVVEFSRPLAEVRKR